MVKPNSPFNEVYQQSTLLQAGIRFDFNIVDTVCRRRLGLTWSIALLVEVLLVCAGLDMLPGGIGITLDGGLGTNLYLGAIVFLMLYLVWYALRLAYYLRLRQYLRKDQAPIAVEAYAVVCLDVKRKPVDNWCCAFWGNFWPFSQKYAVVYKEVGSNQPRFFLSAAVSCRRINYVPEQIGRVFIHRKQAKLYTLDDTSAYQTVSAKRFFAKRLVTSAQISQNATTDNSTNPAAATNKSEQE